MILLNRISAAGMFHRLRPGRPALQAIGRLLPGLACGGMLLCARPVGAYGTVTNLSNPAQLEAALAGGGLVVFAASGTLTLTQTLTITANTWLDAAGQTVTLSGGATTSGGGVRLFNVSTGVTFLIRGLSLERGSSTNGGAILNFGTLLLNSCTFAANAARGPDGADGADGRDSSNNGEDGRSGTAGRAAFGGAIYNVGRLEATNCAFLQNAAVGGLGGDGGRGGSSTGGLVGGSGGNGGGGGQGHGGAIYSLGSLALVNCTFATNAALGGSAGAGGDGGSATNGLSAGEGGDGGSGASALGGAIFASGTTFLMDCSFRANYVTAGSGGAGGVAGGGGSTEVYPGDGGGGAAAHGAGLYTTRQAWVENCTFDANTGQGGSSADAGTYPSGMGIDGRDGGGSSGAGLYASGTNSVLNSTFYRNTVAGGAGGDGGPSTYSPGSGGNGGDAVGGGLYNSGRTYVTNCTFAAGSAVGGTNGVAGGVGVGVSNGRLGYSRGANIANGSGTFVLKNSLLEAFATTNVVSLTNFTWQTNLAGCSSNRTVLIDTACTTNLISIGQTNISICTTTTTYTTTTTRLTNTITQSTTTTTNTEFAVTWFCVTNEVPFGTPIVITCPTNITVNLELSCAGLVSASSTNVTVVTNVSIGANSYGTISNAGFNLSSDTTPAFNNALGSRNNTPLLLGSFGDYGGHTYTLPLQPSSPAVDGGDPWLCLPTDQRGVPRPFGGRCDAGAYEAEVGNIRGRVLLEGGGLSGVTMTAGGFTTTTDTNGAYVLSGLLAGSYQVVPSRAGYEFEPPSHAVDVAQDATGVDFLALTTFTIRGRVLDGTGGLRGVVVSAGGRSAVTDITGAYAISGLRAGTYTVAPGYEGAEFDPPLQVVTLGPDATNVNFAATGVYVIVGRVTEGTQPLAGVTVTAGNRSATTDGAGNYLLSDLLPRAYAVTPTRAGYEFDPPSRSLALSNNATSVDFDGYRVFSISGQVTQRGIGLGGVHVTAGAVSTTTAPNGTYTLAAVRAGAVAVVPALEGYQFDPPTNAFVLVTNTLGVDFAAGQFFTIGGRVIYGTNGLEGVTVEVGSETVVTDEDGRYLVANLPAGSYTVTPLLEGYDFQPAPRTITVGPNATNVSFTAAGIYTLGGTVTRSGQPLGNVAVTVSGQTVLTGPDGRYAVSNLPPGSYDVTPALARHAFSPALYQGLILGPSLGGLDFEALPVYAVSGRVTDGTNGFPGVTVKAGDLAATTDANGNYVFSGVPAGETTIVPTLTGFGFIPPARTFDLQGNTVGIDFVASLLFHISGRVTVGTNGISGMRISSSSGGSATSDGQGYYTLNATFVPGEYEITIRQVGVGFEPAPNRVTVIDQDVTNANFTALPPRVTNIVVTAGGPAALSVLGPPSWAHTLEASEDLVSWAVLASTNSAANGTLRFVDSNAHAHPTRFYRVSAH